MFEEMSDERRSTIIFDEMTGTKAYVGEENILEERISLARKMILPDSIPIAYADLLMGRRRRPRFNFIPELLELKPNPLWAETEYPVRPIDIQRGGWGR